jgi:threonine dehydrogenase-like Zn-dependent dehydrogenase
MRAARIVVPRRLEIEEVALPSVGPREVRFKVEGCGVCASNLGPWLGLPWMKYPMKPGESGHEAWGVVDAIGSEVSGVAPGQRIAAVSYNAYAEFDVANDDAFVPLPPSLDGKPFPGEPIACAINALSRSRIKPGDTVAVVGVGFLGALLTRLVSHLGANVIAISRRQFALDIAKAMGAQTLVPMLEHSSVIAQVSEITRGAMCDCVIEAVGLEWPLNLAAELTKTRGTLVIAGYHQDGPRSVNIQLWNWKGLDVINAHEREVAVYREGIRKAAEAVAEEVLDPSVLCTHRYPLDQLGIALDATHERPDGFLKALVIP